MKAVVVSVAVAWTVPGPAVQYQPSVVAAPQQGFYGSAPVAQYQPAVAPQLTVVAQPTQSRGTKLDPFNMMTVFSLSALAGYGLTRYQAALAVKGKAPKGPFGGSGGPDDGWIGDQGRSVQVEKFEGGTDYLFFQGPAPTTAVQDDLPSFLSAENFADMEIKPLQIVFTVVGFGAFAVLLSVLLS